MITCDCQHLKNEAKCLATATSEGSGKRTLKCNDECARLERNRKLALALNIDPDTHTNDHIPYSAETLNMYQQHTTVAQTIERELRILAADEKVKIHRFKPMPSSHRAFIHALAEDFGLDGESMDPEPHRHVSIFKTPRFVAMPMKTLAECVRIRNRNHALATNAATSAFQAQRSLGKHAYNGFVLSSPKFALTVGELRTALTPTFKKHPFSFDISFLPSEEVVLKAHDSPESDKDLEKDPEALESELRALKPGLATVIASNHLAASTSLCALDASLNVLRTDRDATEGGWNVVARSRPARKEDVVPSKPSLMKLGGKKLKADKKPAQKTKAPEEEVVDDWLEAALKEEGEGAAQAEEDGLASGQGGGDKEVKGEETEAPQAPANKNGP